MGSTTFEAYGGGVYPDVTFRELREEAAHECGHGGYTGSIAEKDSYVVIQREPVTYAHARLMARQLINSGDERVDDKWGPAGAIPVVADSAVKTRNRTVTFDLQDARHLSDSDLETHVRPLVDLRDGEAITGLEIVEDAVTRRVIVETMPGRSELTYHIVPAGQLPSRNVEGCANMAQARQRLRAMLEEKKASGESWGPFDYEIIGLTAREGGRGLISGTLKVKSRKVKARVTISSPGAPGRSQTPVGWLFFGWASI